MNYDDAHDEYSNLLSKTIGYGRYLTLIRQFVTLNCIPTLSDMELKFVVRNIDILSTITMMKINRNIQKNYSSFFCSLCNKVGKHSTRTIGATSDDHVCASATTWFDQFGILPDHSNLKTGTTHVKIISRDLIIHKGCDFNIRSILKNEEIRESVTNKLHAEALNIRNSLTKRVFYRKEPVNQFSQCPYSYQLALAHVSSDLEDEHYHKKTNLQEFFNLNFDFSQIELIDKKEDPDPFKSFLSKSSSNSIPTNNLFSSTSTKELICDKCSQKKTIFHVCK
jgi:hypothetical protein